MSPAPFIRVLAQAQLPPSWIAAILDSQGNVVARSRGNEQFTGQAASPALRAAIAQAEEGVLDGLALHPATPLAVFARSPATGWTVVIGIPSAMLANKLLETLAGLGVAILLLFAFSLAVARQLGSRITHAIRSLTAPAMALGE